MIKMVNKQEILIRSYRLGHSQRRISRDLGFSRRTVARYLAAYESFKCGFPELSDQESLGHFLQQAPIYASGTRPKRDLSAAMIAQLDAYMVSNTEKRSTGLHKQLMKKVDMHEGLLSEGYSIGYTTVCNYVRGKEIQAREAYIRQDYEAGVSCEFDWAEVKLTIGGQSYRLMLALFSPCYSNYRWAKLYWRQDSVSFQSAHVHFFRATGGVYQELIYDNMRVAVRKFVGAHEREPTQGLLELSGHYQFSYRFCNVGKGNEKGHVERAVEYIRRKTFCQRDTFESLLAAQTHLDAVCAGLNNRPLKGRNASPGELLAHEQNQLYDLVSDFSAGEWLSLRINTYSCFCCGQNHYSVPDHLVGKMVDIRLCATELKVYYEGEKLCVHQRAGGQHSWNICLDHFLQTLLRKPGALAGSVALKSAPEAVKAIFERHFIDRPKVFVELLAYQRKEELSWEALESAIEACLESCPHQAPALDKIKYFCLTQKAPETFPPLLADPLPSEAQQAILEAAEAQLEELNALLSLSH
jgi:transposase